MSKERDSQKRVAFPIKLFADAEAATADKLREIHIVPTGVYEHWSGFKFEINSEVVAQIASNFKTGVRKAVPITAGHDFGGETPAVGWFVDVIDRGVKGVYGIVEWNEAGIELLSTKKFKFFSAEIDFDYHDPETARECGVVLTGGALTNKPFFKQLDLDPSAGFSDEDRAVAASVLMFSVPDIIGQFNQPMDLNTILGKKAEELSAEEKTFLKQNEASLDDAQKDTFKDVLADAPAPAATKEEPTPVVVASDKGTHVLTAAEFAALSAAANEGQKALQKIEASERKAFVTGMIFSAGNKDGRFLPKEEADLTVFVTTLSESQRATFKTLVSKIPQTALFNEIGASGADSPNDAQTIYAQEIKPLVRAKIAADAKLDFATALSQVYFEQPDLKKKYEAALEAAE